MHVGEDDGVRWRQSGALDTGHDAASSVYEEVEDFSVGELDKQREAGVAPPVERSVRAAKSRGLPVSEPGPGVSGAVDDERDVSNGERRFRLHLVLLSPFET